MRPHDFEGDLTALEGKDGILSVSAVRCSPYVDVEEIGPASGQPVDARVTGTAHARD